ncbi:MAG: metalloprotease PmbA [Burkholderiales bacterium]
MVKPRFSYELDDLRQLAADTLAAARSQGASEAEANVSEGFGQTVSVRKGEIETIEHNRDKEIGVSCYVGKRSGYASTSDFSRDAIASAVRKALTIAKFTAEDDASGLAEPELLAREIHDLDLYHPWDLTVDRAATMARQCEEAAFALDRRISNSEGASISCQESQFASAMSNGFSGAIRSSRHYVSCSVIAGENDQMQRDDWYSSARSADELASPSAIGDYAGRRALARLRSRKINTTRAPVIFEAPLATGLIGHFVSAVSGGSLYRKSSFLLDSLGKSVFSPIVNLREEPHLRRGHASSYFDDDGVATRARDVIKDGVVNGYFLGVYSARKLGMKSTGSAGGNQNLILRSGQKDLQALLGTMGRGLLVTELMGQGINLVTGDYSRGAAGFWIENGEIQFPVEEVTIAGNLSEMFKNVAAIGNDVLTRGSRTTGSILVDGMMIAGS